MNELKKILFRLRMEYMAVWAVAILLVVLFEFECLLPGLFAGEERAVYLAQTISILITLGCIPLALKLFSLKYVERRLREGGSNLTVYRGWCEVRIALLAFPLIINLLLYYLIMEVSSAYCALIVVLAMLFCWPSESRLNYETANGEAANKSIAESVNKTNEEKHV